MDVKQYYSQKLEEAKNKSMLLRRKYATNAALRLGSFLLIFFFLFGLINYNTSLAIVLAALSLIAFLLLVRRHVLLQKKRNYFMELERHLGMELEACNYNFKNFPTGEKYADHHHSYSYDLDIFGTGSLFQMIDRTVTQDGTDALAQELIGEPGTNRQILQDQEALKELSKMPDLLLHFRTTGSTSGIAGDEKTEIVEWIKRESFVSQKIILRYLSYILPSFTIGSFLLLVFGITNSSLFVIFFLTNLVIVGAHIRRINREHAQISRFLKLIEKYRSLLQVIEEQQFQSEKLIRLKENFHCGGQLSWQNLDKLAKLVSAFDNRLNIVVALFLEGIFLWDYHCLFRIEKWKKEFGTSLPLWFDSIALFDVLATKSCFVFNNPDFHFPELSESSIFSAKQIGHPLIHANNRVNNDFVIESKGKFCIITGANMAGKSTFLRTVGVNMVIGKMGMPVCAEHLVFTPMKMFTSMRTSDSLAENESYFYAELRRLQEMFLLLEKGEPIFIILDEILKGTNSVDKQRGSFAAMEKILRLNGTGIIATHDLALTSIAQKYEGSVKNQCFEIEINNAEIKFDYKLYEGVTQKMNAMLLMEQMGII